MSDPRWQPIETAPKHEEPYILGLDRHGEIEIIQWQNIFPIMSGRPRREGWTIKNSFDDEYCLWEEFKPIKWMPLPEA